MSRRPLLATLVSAALVPTTFAPPPVQAAETFNSASAAAFNAFAKGDYKESEQRWRAVCEAFPTSALAWSNFAVALVINASDDMVLGVKPSGRPLERLEEALRALNTAEKLTTLPDALLLNSKGNALGLLQRWVEARDAYEQAAAAASRDFESIPRSNKALVELELGEMQAAERTVQTLLQRDPSFKDGVALLATIRWARGDVGGAVKTFTDLCDQPTWCMIYSSEEAVRGRWTPAAIEAFRGLLREPSVKLEIRDARIR